MEGEDMGDEAIRGINRESENCDLEEIKKFWIHLGYSDRWVKPGFMRLYLQKLDKYKIMHAIEIMDDKYRNLDTKKYGLFRHEGAFRYVCGILRNWIQGNNQGENNARQGDNAKIE
jgi:hypothetical protein